MQMADIERRALALYEHLADDPDNPKLRARFLRSESEAVVKRVEALVASAQRAEGSIPTLIPGAASASDALPPPERIGPFRLTERVGRGGMGDVWAGERADGLFEQRVAIKLIQRHALTRAAAAFDDERRFLAKLEHPNIARLIDGGVTEDGLPWLAMEFIDGQSIDEACATMPLAERVRMFVKAADAVHYAHSRMVAHADLKPGNILVDGEGRVKLLDFGISQLIGQGGASLTGSGPLTREFASPQRIAGGGPSVPDDIYALGKSLALVARESADGDLRAISRKASAMEEADRYGSVSELINDLDRWREHRPVAAMHDGLAYRTAKFVERHRFGVLASAAAFAIFAGTGIFAGTSYFRAENQKAEASASRADTRKATQFMLFDLMDRLEMQPRSLALRVKVAGEAQIYLDRLSTSPDALPAQQLEAADGLWRLAQRQAKPGQANLRQPQAALANLERAMLLIRARNDREARLLEANILIDLASIKTFVLLDHPSADLALREADRILGQAEPVPGETRGAYLLALAQLRGWQGRYADQIRHARKAVEVSVSGEDKRTILFSAASADLIAEGQYYLGDIAAAEIGYRRQIGLLSGALRRWPADGFLQGTLARANWNLGTTLIQRKRYLEALPVLAKSAELGEAAVAFDPDDEETKRRLRIIHTAQAQNLSYLKRIDEALPIFDLIVSETRAESQANPKDPSRLRDHAMAMVVLAEGLSVGGRIKQGCAADQAAMQLFNQLKSMGKLSGFDADENVGVLKRRHHALCKEELPG